MTLQPTPAGKRVLLTGGAGFIGHHLARTIFERTEWHVTFIDRLDFPTNYNRVFPLRSKYHDRCNWVLCDLADPQPLIGYIGKFDYILHLAALTHVDRAISDPLLAVRDNILGTAHLLEYARHEGCERLLYFSTDEVFGPAPSGVRFKEWGRYNSTNPYSATKAGGEELALAYANTYGVPVFVTHTMNVFGERQHPEKYIPSTIRKIGNSERVLIHADETRTSPGSRFYLHVDDVADAVLFLLDKADIREKYNIVGAEEVDNLRLALQIGEVMKRRVDYELVDFHSARPGHDLRYALDGTKMENMGWRPKRQFSDRLTQTVQWYLNNPAWLSRSTSAVEAERRMVS